jgi:DNA-binding MarR family transcriptional regulator
MSDELLRIVGDTARALKRAFDSCARQHGVTREQWLALLLLSRAEGTNQARLADLLDMEPIGLCRMIDRLEAAGLVRREPDPVDRRARRLYLTREGWTKVDQMRPVAAEFSAGACAGIDPLQLSRVIEVLARIRTNVSGIAATGESGETPNPDRP